MAQVYEGSRGIDRLSSTDIHLVQECLNAAVDGPFFPDWEFHILMGLERDDVRQVASEWPATLNADTRDLAVTNVLNNLLGYPHKKWEAKYEDSSCPNLAARLAPTP